MTEWKRQEGEETIFRTCAWSPPGEHPVGWGLRLYYKDDKLHHVEGGPDFETGWPAKAWDKAPAYLER